MIVLVYRFPVSYRFLVFPFPWPERVSLPPLVSLETGVGETQAGRGNRGRQPHGGKRDLVTTKLLPPPRALLALPSFTP